MTTTTTAAAAEKILFALIDQRNAITDLINAMGEPIPATPENDQWMGLRVARDQLNEAITTVDLAFPEPEHTTRPMATYTETGDLSVTEGGVHLAVGTFDADGGEWIPAVDALLTAAGFERTGDWSGDVAPVRRTA